ncbi:alpha/beta hydrolase [Croceicoccus mobilis]|uniref:Alpha/beta hydrolase n=1 Tax=Croceicoccus mobilis TaxID=1703339 RepID=A0A916Z920_9SPHN|nr:alpha/beta hydrolase [Croceicoccus mobilis]GGD82512.1 alpha/beta hydrolase [Croceicoccus mobilis]
MLNAMARAGALTGAGLAMGGGLGAFSAQAEVLPPGGDGGIVRLWPGAAPGMPDGGVQDEFVNRNKGGGPDDIAWPHVADPVMTVTPSPNPSGAAMLLIPGGGYARVAVGRKSMPIALWFASLGVTTFTLRYRLAHDGWAAGPDTPLQDAQRAMRLIRSWASHYGYDAENVGAMGFSAGGHLCGMLSTRSGDKTYDAVDAADGLSARPKVSAMLFPVVSMMAPLAHAQSRTELLGENPSAELEQRYSLERNIPADCPPIMLGQAADDEVVPVGNSIAMFQGLKAAQVPSELFIIEEGGHGAPMLTDDGDALLWLSRFSHFAPRHGLPMTSV